MAAFWTSRICAPWRRCIFQTKAGRRCLNPRPVRAQARFGRVRLKPVLVTYRSPSSAVSGSTRCRQAPMTFSLDQRTTSGSMSCQRMASDSSLLGALITTIASWAMSRARRTFHFMLVFPSGVGCLLTLRARHAGSEASSTAFSPRGFSRSWASPARSVARARRRPGSVCRRAVPWARSPRRLATAGNE
jgi:hypothetical protein